jgi:dopamine beta-monooxygenase
MLQAAKSSIMPLLQVDAVGWVGFGITEVGGMRGADIMYFETANNGSLTDAYTLDYSKPIVDDHQDWTLKSSSLSGGVLTIEATRSLDTQDPQDKELTNDAYPAIDGTRVIAAWGDTRSIQFHSLNRVTGQIRFFGSAGIDPLASIKNDPAVRSFTILQNKYPIPTAATTYNHQCFPMSSASNGPIPSTSTQHIVAIEYVPDPSGQSQANVHHIVVTCFKTAGTGGSDFWPIEYLRNLSSTPSEAKRLKIWPVPSFPPEFDGTA